MRMIYVWGWLKRDPTVLSLNTVARSEFYLEVVIFKLESQGNSSTNKKYWKKYSLIANKLRYIFISLLCFKQKPPYYKELTNKKHFIVRLATPKSTHISEFLWTKKSYSETILHKVLTQRITPLQIKIILISTIPCWYFTDD